MQAALGNASETRRACTRPGVAPAPPSRPRAPRWRAARGAARGDRVHVGRHRGGQPGGARARAGGPRSPGRAQRRAGGADAGDLRRARDLVDARAPGGCRRAGRARARGFRGDPAAGRRRRAASIPRICARRCDPRRCWSRWPPPITRSATFTRSRRWPAMARAAGVLFHTDAVAAAGRVPFDVRGARRRRRDRLGAQDRGSAGGRRAVPAAWGRARPADRRRAPGARAPSRHREPGRDRRLRPGGAPRGRRAGRDRGAGLGAARAARARRWARSPAPPSRRPRPGAALARHHQRRVRGGRRAADRDRPRPRGDLRVDRRRLQLGVARAVAGAARARLVRRSAPRWAVRITLGRTTTDGEIDRLLEVLPGIVARACAGATTPAGRGAEARRGGGEARAGRASPSRCRAASIRRRRRRCCARRAPRWSA